MAVLSAINLSALLGSQLSALIEAEVEGAEKSADFIESVGFEKQDDGTQRLRMVTFEMPRRDSDGTVRKHTISVPVLTLVPIPLLSIEEATVDFKLLVERQTVSETETSGSSSGGTGSSLGGAFRARQPIRRVNLLTRLARTTQQETETTSDLKMKIKISQSPFPLGIEHLLNTAILSTKDETDE